MGWPLTVVAALATYAAIKAAHRAMPAADDAADDAIEGAPDDAIEGVPATAGGADIDSDSGRD